MPEELATLIQRLHYELDLIEQDANNGIKVANEILELAKKAAKQSEEMCEIIVTHRAKYIVVSIKFETITKRRIRFTGLFLSHSYVN